MLISIESDGVVLKGWWIVLAIVVTAIAALMALVLGISLGQAIRVGDTLNIGIYTLLLGLLAVAQYRLPIIPRSRV